MAAERRGSRGENGEGMSSGTARGMLILPLQLIWASQARSQVRGHTGGGGGHLLLPIGKGEDDRGRAGLGQVSDR